MRFLVNNLIKNFDKENIIFFRIEKMFIGHLPFFTSIQYNLGYKNMFLC